MLLNDGDQDVDGNRDPYLRPNRVVRRAVELFDPQMLLDPFEKQFDLPAAFIEGADRRRRQGKLIGQKNESFTRFDILEPNSAQMNWIVLTGGKTIQRDSLVGDDTARSIGRRGVDAVRIEVCFARVTKKASA